MHPCVRIPWAIDLSTAPLRPACSLVDRPVHNSGAKSGCEVGRAGHLFCTGLGVVAHSAHSRACASRSAQRASCEQASPSQRSTHRSLRRRPAEGVIVGTSRVTISDAKARQWRWNGTRAGTNCDQANRPHSLVFSTSAGQARPRRPNVRLGRSAIKLCALRLLTIKSRTAPIRSSCESRSCESGARAVVQRLNLIFPILTLPNAR
jgi:hypothetical protein